MIEFFATTIPEPGQIMFEHGRLCGSSYCFAPFRHLRDKDPFLAAITAAGYDPKKLDAKPHERPTTELHP